MAYIGRAFGDEQMKTVLLEESKGSTFKAVVSQVPVPRAGPGELVVEMKACGLCGTDIEKINGHYTASRPILGHEAVGTVAQVGSGVEGFTEGEAVFPHHHVPCYECHLCRSGSETMCQHYRANYLEPGGFSEFFRVPRWNVSKGGVLKIPEGVGFEVASLIEPVGCCVRGLKKCGVRAGESVLVVGAGPVGMIHALLLKSMGAEVLISDVSDARLDFGRELGVGTMVDAKAEDVGQAAKAATDGMGVDLAMVATGDGRAIVSALDSVRKGGRVCLFGVPPVGSTLDYDISKIFNSETSLLTTYGATEADTRKALDFLEVQGADFRRLVTHTFPIDSFGSAVEAATRGVAMKVVITP